MVWVWCFGPGGSEDVCVGNAIVERHVEHHLQNDQTVTTSTDKQLPQRVQRCQSTLSTLSTRSSSTLLSFLGPGGFVCFPQICETWRSASEVCFV